METEGEEKATTEVKIQKVLERVPKLAHIVIKLGTQLIIIIGSMDFLQTSNKRSVVNCVEEEGPNDDNRSLA